MENKLKRRSEVSDEYKWDLTPIYKDVLEFDKDYTKASELIDNFKNMYHKELGAVLGRTK